MVANILAKTIFIAFDHGPQEDLQDDSNQILLGNPGVPKHRACYFW
jgi:hypothetical protein